MATTVVCAVLSPVVANADDTVADKAPFEISLDMDRDGLPDHASVIEGPTVEDTDLRITLSAAAGSASRPEFVKHHLAEDRILELRGTENGSLVVEYGCGGCSNDTQTTLTIVYRDGRFVVAGYRFDWDTRTAIGVCDINFLTGKGVASLGIDGKNKPIKGKFVPVSLAEWTDKGPPDACEF